MYDDWYFDDQLQHFGRLLAADSAAPGTPGADKRAATAKIFRFDPTDPGLAGQHGAQGRRRPSAAHGPPRSVSATAWLSWPLLVLGLTTLVCGGVLLVWSLVGARPDLWPLGLPLALGGQMTLVVRLVLQLHGLRHDHRTATARLESVDDALDELRSANILTTASQNAPGGGNFYAHLAGGAGPALLLADLKGQLDLLAARMRE
jgi:hypothetical protein